MDNRTRLGLLLAFAVVLGARPVAAQAPAPAGVTPAAIAQGDSIFHSAGNCYACHGPDQHQRKADLHRDERTAHTLTANERRAFGLPRDHSADLRDLRACGAKRLGPGVARPGGAVPPAQ